MDKARPMEDGFSACVAGLVALTSLLVLGIIALTLAGVAR